MALSKVMSCKERRSVDVHCSRCEVFDVEKDKDVGRPKLKALKSLRSAGHKHVASSFRKQRPFLCPKQQEKAVQLPKDRSLVDCLYEKRRVSAEAKG